MPKYGRSRLAKFAGLEFYSAISACNPGNQSMPRYNMRTLRGERVNKKKEGDRIKRWESDYMRFINDDRNVLSVEEVMAEIAETFENNAIEQTKVSLICPLTKERIVVPVRYRACRHLQCFDLKSFLAMKSKRNFLECPICNTKVDSELTGLQIDKYFQKILSNVSDITEIDILCDGTFRVAPLQSALIIPKVIDDEGQYEPEHSAALTCKVKSESGNDIDEIEELGSASSFDNAAEANGSNDETQNLHVSYCSMADDITQEAHSGNEKARSKIDEKRFKCGICTYSTKYNYHLLTHNRIHTGEKLYKCDQCYYSSADSRGLKAHIRTHTGEKPYKCSQCSYACANSSGLRKHMRTHTGEKPYKCNQCSFASANPSGLKRHISTHNGEKPYKCSQCSFASAEAGTLNRHMRIHTGEKPYKCGQCSYASAQPGHLQRHMLTHTGEKTYKCMQCTFSTAEAGHLQRHTRIHTGEKPYKCSQCSFASAQPGGLNVHIRIHTGEKPYKCSQCSYASAQAGPLRKHMRTHI